MKLHPKRQTGSAALIVLVLLAAMTTLSISNNIALAKLKRELTLIERRHDQRYGEMISTNKPGSQVPGLRGSGRRSAPSQLPPNPGPRP